MEKNTENKEINIKEMNIFEKLSKITEEIGIVAKNLNVGVGKGTYKAVSERDILDAVKPIENKYRVYSYPVNREIVESDTLTKETDYQGKVTTSNSLYLRIKVVYRFVNIDKTDEFIDITSYADGIDTGDKATGKAMTYADKYALMKAYKISTGEDPDKEASPEKGYAKRSQSNTNNSVPTNREKLIKLCNEKGLNMTDIAKQYKLSSQSSDSDFLLALVELEKGDK